MDAFAVSVCKGLGMTKINKKEMLIIGLYFGGFQGIMPLLGWALSTKFSHYVANYAHFIAFILLAYIGGKMVFEAIQDDDGCNGTIKDKPLNHREMFILAIATSIDALAVGISFAVLGRPIKEPIIIIGLCTFIISILGVYIGNVFGTKYKNKAELLGGFILIGIGLKILIEYYI